MNLLFKEIDMLSGLEIVLERIKEYPEELPKWADILVDYLQYFTEEEVQAWLDIKIQVGRERFNERVLKHLSGNDVQEQVTGFQNEVSRIIASKQQQMLNKVSNGIYDPRGVYGNPIQSAAAQQVMYNPYANNNR
jgi:hypothetical protein